MRQSVVKLGFFGSGARGHHRLTALGGASKRTFDVIIAGIALVLLSPLLAVMVLLLRFLMRGPILLGEGKIGFEGKAFNCYRFQTSLAESAGVLDRENNCLPTGQQVRRSKHAPWVEHLGTCLRASDLDKLPRLVNILRGDMSLVGPQPIAPEQLPHYCAYAPEVLLARPGLIGVWSNTPRGLRMHATDIALDRYYVLHWSMWLDLKIACDAFARARA